MRNRTSNISVIICAYTEERWHGLMAAIRSVQAQILSAREIIVVIDHNPLLFQRLRRYGTGITIIENTGIQGLSGARNSGIAQAQGHIIAFLDDDAVATPHWLATLAQCYTDPQVIGAGGAVTPVWTTREKPRWLPEEFYWVVGCTYRGVPQATATVRNPIGANMSLRKEVFIAIGGFRSEIGRIGSRPIGCEETELCIRAHQHWPQGIVLYHTRAQVFHRVPLKRTTWRYFCSRCYAEGISKAIVSHFVGSKDSLATERSYTTQTLPSGMIRGVSDALFHRDLSGIVRAGAILIGLTITIAGYIAGKIATRKSMSVSTDQATNSLVSFHAYTQ